MADLTNYYDGIPKAEPEKTVLNALLYDYLQHNNFKNTTQRNAVVQILKRDSDVLVSLPKGQGRTTCFQLPIMISQKKVSIVFVGKSARIKKQVARLNSTHVYADIIDAGTSSEKWDHIIKTIMNLSNIRSTLNTILYVAPGVLPNIKLLNLLHDVIELNSLGYIVVDISYCENNWLSGPTEEQYELRLLRNTYFNIPWVVTTEKASFEIANYIKTTLCLRNRSLDIGWDYIHWFGMNIEDDDVQEM